MLSCIVSRKHAQILYTVAENQELATHADLALQRQGRLKTPLSPVLFYGIVKIFDKMVQKKVDNA